MDDYDYEDCYVENKILQSIIAALVAADITITSPINNIVNDRFTFQIPDSPYSIMICDQVDKLIVVHQPTPTCETMMFAFDLTNSDWCANLEHYLGNSGVNIKLPR